ncbi:MAG: diguanylate cyclase [Pseudomonadota bacterium]
MAGISIELLQAALRASNDGLVIAEMGLGPNRPIVYVNPAFETLTGYTAQEILGNDCRFLNQGQRDQEGLDVVRRALLTGRPCRVVLQNLKKSGEPFWNELDLSPVRSKGVVTHFIGIQKDVTQRVMHEQYIEKQNRQLQEQNQQLQDVADHDALTRLHNRHYFDAHFARQLAIHQRLQSPLAVLYIDVDCFKRYNDCYGHHQGDLALLQVARAIRSQFARESDLVARYGGDEFIVACSLSGGDDELLAQVQRLHDAVAALGIQHEDSTVADALTVSVGVCTGVPPQQAQEWHFGRRADQAMYQAKHQGGNRTVQVAA